MKLIAMIVGIILGTCSIALAKVARRAAGAQRRRIPGPAPPAPTRAAAARPPQAARTTMVIKAVTKCLTATWP